MILGIATAGIVMIVAVILNIKKEIKGAATIVGHIAVKDAVAKTLAVMKDGVHAVIRIIIMEEERLEQRG
ncbi:hypothetical protein D2M30_0792 [Bacillus amyloliquefaciens]|nr:hypothetical protein [Bacillus amyloliquefaciens]QBG55143.1 hypothetical protein D2M30_0792 [Bacillus amyloliquefaciens]